MMPRTIRQAEKLMQSRDDLRAYANALNAENERLRAALQSLWDAVARYGAIGHEGSELLEVMSDASAVLEPK